MAKSLRVTLLTFCFSFEISKWKFPGGIADFGEDIGLFVRVCYVIVNLCQSFLWCIDAHIELVISALSFGDLLEPIKFCNAIAFLNVDITLCKAIFLKAEVIFTSELSPPKYLYG